MIIVVKMPVFIEKCPEMLKNAPKSAPKLKTGHFLKFGAKFGAVYFCGFYDENLYLPLYNNHVWKDNVFHSTLFFGWSRYYTSRKERVYQVYQIEKKSEEDKVLHEI